MLIKRPAKRTNEFCNEREEKKNIIYLTEHQLTDHDQWHSLSRKTKFFISDKANSSFEFLLCLS
jgi:hypothetical protein